MTDSPTAARAAGLVFLFSALSLADPLPVPAATTAAEPVVVTATRTTLPAAEALVPVQVIGADEIARSGARDLPELLRRRAGIELSRNGGPGQTTSVFLRGAESNHTLVLVDGVKINPGTLGVAALQHLDPSMVERIEVVRGPRSTLYGSDAIGGVIQIFTRRTGPGARGTRTAAALSAGADAWRGLDLTLQHTGGQIQAGVQVAGVRTDGFPARVGGTEDSGYRNTSLSAYATHRGGRWLTTLSHWQARGETEYYGFDLSPLSQDHDNAVTALTLQGPLGARGAATLRASHMQDRITQNESPDFATTRRSVLDGQYDLELGGGLLTAGLVLERQDASARSFGTRLDERLDHRALYVQWQQQRGRHRYTLGARWLDHDAFGAHTTWELAYGYQATPRLLWRAAAGTGFRAPDATDRFGFGGNPDLAPETARSVEAGLRYQAGRGESWTATVFRNDINDLITFTDPDGFFGPLPGRNENIGRARIQGLELAYRLHRGPWRLRVGGVWQDPENRAGGRQLARRAKRNLSAVLDYVRARARAGIALQAASSRPDSDFSDTVNAGYTLVHLSAGRRIAPGWWLQARLENALDRDYVLAEGFNTQGRALFLQLAWQGNR